jgi:integrase
VSSPCRVKGAGTEHASERPIATIDEVSALTAAMPAHLQIAVDLAVWCQLRRGEIFGLERRDVDLDGGTIRIERSRTFLTSGTSITKVPKTRAGRRVLSVPTSPLGRLRQHMDVHVDDFPESPILVGRDHRALSATALQRAWQRARVVVGRDDLHFHDLRHTGLTLAASTGATTAEIMRRAGHTSSDAALRYQHATLERDRILASRLEDLAST